MLWLINISNKKMIYFIFTEIEKSIGSLKFASGSGLERQVRQKRSDFETTPGKISLMTKSWLNYYKQQKLLNHGQFSYFMNDSHGKD